MLLMKKKIIRLLFRNTQGSSISAYRPSLIKALNKSFCYSRGDRCSLYRARNRRPTFPRSLQSSSSFIQTSLSSSLFGKAFTALSWRIWRFHLAAKAISILKDLPANIVVQVSFSERGCRSPLTQILDLNFWRKPCLLNLQVNTYVNNNGLFII